MEQDVYSGRLKLLGEEHPQTLLAANNYASSLVDLQRFEEANSLLRRTMPVARRVLGDNDRLMLKMRKIYARALHENTSATLDDLREAVTTLEDAGRIARRVLGGAHPTTLDIEATLRVYGEIHGIREELEANQAALRASITRLYQLACALVALLVVLVAAIVFKR